MDRNAYIYFCTLKLFLHTNHQVCTLAEPLNTTPENICLTDSYFVYGHAGKTKLYRNITDATLFSCAAECRSSRVCNSFNFNTMTSACELSSHGPQIVTGLDKAQGIIFSNKEAWSGLQILEGACASSKCPDNARCYVDRLGRFACTEEYGECGEPLPRDNSKMNMTGTDVGSRLKLSCNEGFFMCGNNNEATCTVRGSWEGLDGKCVNGTIKVPEPQIWRNRYRLPCPLNPGKMIKIKMRISKRCRIVISRGPKQTLLVDSHTRKGVMRIAFRYAAKTHTKTFKFKLNKNVTFLIYRGKSSLHLQIDETFVVFRNLKEANDGGNFLVIRGRDVIYKIEMSAKF